MRLGNHYENGFRGRRAPSLTKDVSRPSKRTGQSERLREVGLVENRIHNAIELRFRLEYGKIVHAEYSTTAGWRSGSAAALQAEGHKFKSCTGHHNLAGQKHLLLTCIIAFAYLVSN